MSGCPNAGMPCNCTGDCLPKPAPGPVTGLGSLTRPYLTLPMCIDSSGHRFIPDPIRPDRTACERCGLIRKAVAF